MRAMYLQIFGQLTKQLAQMDTWLATAAAHAEAKGFDVDVLVTQRLAPDQFALGRQVQIACDTARLGASRITGKETASEPDEETTIAELRARIASTLEGLQTLSEGDFGDAASRTVTQPRWKGQVMDTHDYLLEHVRRASTSTPPTSTDPPTQRRRRRQAGLSWDAQQARPRLTPDDRGREEAVPSQGRPR